MRKTEGLAQSVFKSSHEKSTRDESRYKPTAPREGTFASYDRGFVTRSKQDMFRTAGPKKFKIGNNNSSRAKIPAGKMDRDMVDFTINRKNSATVERWETLNTENSNNPLNSADHNHPSSHQKVKKVPIPALKINTNSTPNVLNIT